MKPFSHIAAAQRLLETRSQGFTFRLFFRRSKKGYLLLLSYYALGIVFLYSFEIWQGVWLMVGMLLGCISRDVSWVRSTRKAWPLTCEVIDWEKVEKLAERN